MLRQYRSLVGIGTITAEALALANIRWETTSLMVAALIVLVGGTMAAYARARNRARHYAVSPSAARTATLAAQSDGLPGGQCRSSSGGRCVVRMARRDDIPDPVALSTNLVVGAGMEAILFLFAMGILYGSRRGSPLRAVSLTVLVAFMWVTGATSAAATLLPLLTPSDETPQRSLPFAMLSIFTAIFIWAMRKARQSRDRSDTTPDECWKLGQFYYNPQDPAFLVERRFGLGYSPNFARPLSWIVIAVFVIAPLLVMATVAS